MRFNDCKGQAQQSRLSTVSLTHILSYLSCLVLFCLIPIPITILILILILILSYFYFVLSDLILILILSYTFFTAARYRCFAVSFTFSSSSPS
jgi:hypothetical protein